MDAENRIETEAIDQQYRQKLVQLASRHLNRHQQSKLDPMDVVQSVFRSYISRRQSGKIDYQNANALWVLLAKMTVRKCIRKNRDLYSQKRSPFRELAKVEFNNGSSTLSNEDLIKGYAPLPEEIAQVNEIVQKLVDGLPSEQQDILVLKLQGYTNLEISSRVNRTERTVYRVLDRIRKKLSEFA